jgi:hypothetical protein
VVPTVAPQRLPVTAEEEVGVPVVLALAGVSPLLWVGLIAVLVVAIGVLLVLLTRRRAGKVLGSGAAVPAVSASGPAGSTWKLKPQIPGPVPLGAPLPPPLDPQPLPPLAPRPDLAEILAEARDGREG